MPNRLNMLSSARQNLLDMQARIGKSLKLVDFFIDGAKSAMEALANGKNPDEAFPLLTREGIATVPVMMSDDGKLEPYMPDLIKDIDD